LPPATTAGSGKSAAGDFFPAQGVPPITLVRVGNLRRWRDPGAYTKMPALVLPGVFRMRTRLALAAMLIVSAFVTEGVLVAVADAAEQPKASDILKPSKQHEISSPITDRFALRISYFAPSIETQFRLDPDIPLLSGTDLIAEDDLGLADHKSQARMEMVIRLRERNRLRVDYFKLSRFGDQVIDQPIIFGNNVFAINDRVQSMLEWRSLGLTYTRSFWKSERFEIAGGLGVALLEARVKGVVAARNIREERSSPGAFPTLAVDGTWRISKRWSLNGRGQRYSAHVNELQGLMAEYHGDLQYRWRENFSAGLGWTKLRTAVDVVDDTDFSGRFHQDVAGPEFFIRASF
jgi:hypothetical protein